MKKLILGLLISIIGISAQAAPRISSEEVEKQLPAIATKTVEKFATEVFATRATVDSVRVYRTTLDNRDILKDNQYNHHVDFNVVVGATKIPMTCAWTVTIVTPVNTSSVQECVIRATPTMLQFGVTRSNILIEYQ